MNHNQILVIHSRGVYNFMGKIWCQNCVSLFCYNALFSKIGFRFRHIFSAICTNKLPIEIAQDWLVILTMTSVRVCVGFGLGLLLLTI